MSLPVIAIIVAGLSALFTGANMALTYANYRRTRPKVQVLLKSLVMREGEGGQIPVVVVTLRNRGQTTARVNTVTATLSKSKKDQRAMNGGVIATEELLLPDADMAVNVFAGTHAVDVPFDLEPFNGTEWFARTEDRVWWAGWGPDGLSELYVTARLSDGTEVCSQRLTLPPGFHETLSGEIEPPDGGQLSFDDLSGEGAG
ncbi:hypothetical protein OHB14_38690 [Streptomyces sp. NBC_01613]|uniref:hypothetical protein n=1 Tax=Streptomyces sp. NBC_01613 TaxID=2975896 RepID=UPI0038657C7B